MSRRQDTPDFKSPSTIIHKGLGISAALRSQGLFEVARQDVVSIISALKRTLRSCAL
jgi:hypothetical protein